MFSLIEMQDSECINDNWLFLDRSFYVHSKITTVHWKSAQNYIKHKYGNVFLYLFINIYENIVIFIFIM